MDKYINRFSQQLKEAIAIGEKILAITPKKEIRQIIISGMGGSGIGGGFVKDIAMQTLQVPVILLNDYLLPAFADENTLFICSSYSGNTEETISTLHAALQRNCMISVVTSGGEIEKIAIENNLPLVIIPGGMPPRSCLGYSLVAQLCILISYQLTDKKIIDDLKKSIDYLEAHENEMQLLAKQIAQTLKNKIPLIYSGTSVSAIGVRWKQQINENAKLHCFTNLVPEMNHNELVAFEESRSDMEILFLRNTTDHPRIQLRFELMKELLAGKGYGIMELFSKGESYIGQLIYFIHLGDWVSCYLAEQSGADPLKIEILDALKRRLG